jgi:protein SCO1/2
MSKKAWFYILFFSFIVIGFYVVVSFLIPDFSKKRMKPIGELRPFSFTNQDGVKVTEKNIEGKVTAVEYFFTTCQGICPRMNNNLRKVYDAYKGENDFLILSHTCDPQTDSVATLKRYADSMQVDTKQWVFLTGRKDSLYHMARHTYKIDDPHNNLNSIEDDFLHTQFIALISRKGEIVKIYDGLKPKEMNMMKDDIAKLLTNKEL